MKHYLSFDLGASSGRAIVIEKEKTIKMIEISRFENKTYFDDGKEYWDIAFILDNILSAIKKAFSLYPTIKSIGIDSWGVDYALIDEFGEIIRKPLYYRNVDTKEAIEFVNQKIGEQNLYKQNGIQFLYFNSIYQLVNDFKFDQSLQEKKLKMLMIPDLIAYYLTGVKKIELTNFSTTGIYNPNTKTLIEDIEKIGINQSIIPKLIIPGEAYGLIKKEIADKLQIPEVPIVAVSTHDTASAVCSLPIFKNNIYISSGTWSLFGSLADEAIKNDKSFTYNFTNEVGFDHKIRFLKNIVGLFIINKCLHEFEKKGTKIDYVSLNQKVTQAPLYQSYIDVDHKMFQNPKSMVKTIQKYCQKSKQPIPETIGEITLCVYQSIAFKYRFCLEQLEEITNINYNKIFVIGGGSDIKILNQLIASVTKRPVIVNAKEATILGNAIVLMLYDKEIPSIEIGRTLIEKSFKQDYYQPKDDLEEEYKKYKKIILGGEKWKI